MGKAKVPNSTAFNALSEAFSNMTKCSALLDGDGPGGERLSWIAELPSFWVEGLHFLLKLLKGQHSGLDEVLDSQLQKDALVQAEAVYMSGPFKILGLLDVMGMIEEHRKLLAPKPAETAAQAVEPTAPPATGEEKAEPEEEMPHVEAAEPMPAAVLDRKSFFPDMILHPVVLDVLNRVDEEKFHQLFDWASLRASLGWYGFWALEFSGLA